MNTRNDQAAQDNITGRHINTGKIGAGALEIIDAAMRFRPAHDAFDVDGLIRVMDNGAIGRAVVAPPDTFLAIHNAEANALILDACAAHPNRLVGLAVMNPWYGDEGATQLETAFKAGLQGLYLCPHRQGFRLTESLIDPLIAVCEQWKRPVYSYLSTPVCAMPFQLAELARRFPRVSFIMGHFAWADFAGDALPAARQADNVYIETSCAPSSLVSEAIGTIGIERVLFGSGYPRSHPEVELFKWNQLSLSDETLGKAMHKNVHSLFGLDQLWT